jgi:hypothetical protein
MARFIKGDIVIVPFPFSDLTQAKREQLIQEIEYSPDTILAETLDFQLAFKAKETVAQLQDKPRLSAAHTPVNSTGSSLS